MRRASVRTLLVLCAANTALVARAQQAPQPASGGPPPSASFPSLPGAKAPLVTLTLAATQADAEAAIPSLRELLWRRGVTLLVQRVEEFSLHEVARAPAGSGPVIARAWVDLKGPGATVLVIDGASEQILARKELPPDDNRQLLLEQIAHVVYTALEAVAPLPSADESASTRSPAADAGEPPLVDRTPPPLDPATPLTLQAMSFHGARWVSSDHVTPTSSLAIGVGSTHGWRPKLWLAGSYEWPVTASNALADVQLRTAELGLWATLEIPVARRVALLAGAGGELVFTSIDVDADESQRAVLRDSEVAPGLRPRLLAGAQLSLSRNVSLFSLLDAQLNLRRTRLLVAGVSGDEVLFEQSRVGLGLCLGLSVTLAGAPEWEAAP